MTDEPRYRCEVCRVPVSPEDHDVVRAVELVRVRAFGTGTEALDGLGVLFHRSCFPAGSAAYRLAPDA